MTLQTALTQTKEYAVKNYRQTLPCGFVYLSVRNVRGKKLDMLKSIGFSKDDYNGGFSFSMSQVTYSQDMYFKRDLAEILKENILKVLPDITLTVWDRMD